MARIARHAKPVEMRGQTLVKLGELGGIVVGRAHRAAALEPEK